MNTSATLPREVLASLPGFEAVRDHTVVVDADRWNRELAARNLPRPQQVAEKSGRIHISRLELMELGAAEPSADSALDLLIVSLAWGLGPRAPRLKARLDALAEAPAQAAHLLLTAWESVRERNPPEKTYSVLTTNRGQGRIPWLGPAFSTKFLYFAHGDSARPTHVILDEVVATNLGPSAWTDPPTAGWWPETYGNYCRLMDNWAREATAELGRDVRPDEVELAVFRG